MTHVVFMVIVIPVIYRSESFMEQSFRTIQPHETRISHI
jgi:hypothetical protein